MSRSLAQRVADRSSATPDAVAIVEGPRRITYRDLAARAAALAARLDDAVRAPATVGVAAPRSIDGVVALLATWWGGHTYLPLDLTQPETRLRLVLDTAGADLVLVADGVEATWVADVPTLRLPETGNVEPVPVRAPAEIAYLVFTSGSTGHPKGIEMTESAIRRLAEWHMAGPDQTGVRTALLAAVGFDVAVQEVVATLTCGGTLVVIDDRTRRDPALLLDALEHHDVHRLFLPTAMLQPLAEEAVRRGGGGRSLRDVVCAGDQLRVTPAVRRWFAANPGASLHNHYGPAETHVVTAHTLSGDPEHWPDVAPIGRPLPHVQVEIVGGDGGTTAPGELVVRGDQVARGYIGRPDLTGERFLDDGGRRGYRTGDLVIWQDQHLVFCGRRDRQVKISGYRVELDEVEAHLAQHPDVSECVVDVQGERGGHELVAYLAPARGRGVTRRDVHAFLAARLPHYMIPARIHVLDRVPLTTNGKLDRAAVAAQVAGAATPEAPPSPGTVPPGDPESVVRRAFEQVLGHRDFGSDENFFDIGGTSLRANQVRALVMDALGREFPITVLYEHPTVRALARALAQDAPPAPGRSPVEPNTRRLRAEAQAARRDLRRNRRRAS